MEKNIILILYIRDGVGDISGGWFGDGVRRRVGDGVATSFWSHRWIGGSPLCVHFPRLFDLAEDKTISVASLFSKGVEQGGWVELEAQVVGVGGGVSRGV